MTVPLFVELCAGTAALSLRLHRKSARPPVSRMGAKTGYADTILRCLGLRPGQMADRYLWCEPDAGVRLMLHAYTDRELALAAAEVIRGWKDEDPRALWERLKAEGPAVCPAGLSAREVASSLYVAANSIYGAGTGFAAEKNGTPGNRWPTHVRCADDLEGTPTLPATITPDARTVDPREVARNMYGAAASYGGPKGGLWDSFLHPEEGGRYGASRADMVRKLEAAPTLPATVHDDARTIDPPQLPEGTVVYADVPYENTTQYAHLFPRSEWLPVVRRWAEAGALVCVSEAEPIPALMAEGWHAVDITGERKGQKRTFGGTREWLTMSRPPSWKPSVQMSLLGGTVTASTGRG